MADLLPAREIDVRVVSIHFPQLPTHRGMARVIFHTDFMDAFHESVELAVEVKFVDQPASEIVKVAYQTLAEDFRRAANRLDEVATQA